MTGDPYDRARRLSRRAGRDAAAIWQWGVVGRLATGLLLTRAGLQPVARPDARRRRPRGGGATIVIQLQARINQSSRERCT